MKQHRHVERYRLQPKPVIRINQRCVCRVSVLQFFFLYLRLFAVASLSLFQCTSTDHQSSQSGPILQTYRKTPLHQGCPLSVRPQEHDLPSPRTYWSESSHLLFGRMAYLWRHSERRHGEAVSAGHVGERNQHVRHGRNIHQSEIEMGRALKELDWPRDEYILATK